MDSDPVQALNSGEKGRRLSYIGGVMQQREKLIRAGAFLSRLLETSRGSHCERIRLAQKMVDILNVFIETEIFDANNLPKADPNYMSWNDIGGVLGISKTAAYSRYGAKCDKRTKTPNHG
jgi:hypothetical protein